MVEMDCREARGLVDASVDEELDAANAARFENHLAECRRCAADRAELIALRAAIRGGATRKTAPDSLRRGLVESLGLASAKSTTRETLPLLNRRALRRWPAVATGFAAGAAL